MVGCSPCKGAAVLTGLNPVEVVMRMRELQEKLMVVDGPDELSREAQRNATLLFLSFLRATFASKRVIQEYKFNREAFDWILGEIETRFNAVRFCSAHYQASMTAEALPSRPLACSDLAARHGGVLSCIMNLEPV